MTALATRGAGVSPSSRRRPLGRAGGLIARSTGHRRAVRRTRGRRTAAGRVASSMMLEALADPAHEEHGQFLTWEGGVFDPAAFELAEANIALQRVR